MFRSIVVGTDGSPTGNEALRRARTLADAFAADLHVVSAYQCPAAVLAACADPGFALNAVGEWSIAARDHVRTLLDGLAGELTGTGASVTTYAVPAHPATAILSVAEEVQADLIVVGNRGMQGGRRFLGSVPNTVSHHAPCSVLIVDTASDDDPS
jgi:nucleotide-binding universal stress UspA family protein